MAAILTLWQTYAAKKDYARLTFLYFSKDTKSLWSSASAKIPDFFYIMKTFEQTVKSELEDSLGEHETSAERNGRDRWADNVRGIICDVTNTEMLFFTKMSILGF